MNSYKLVKVLKFPELDLSKSIHTILDGSLPWFIRQPKTVITYISQNYYSYDYYEIEHEMLIKENGIAFGFIKDNPETMNFHNYLKPYTVKFYYKKEKDIGYLSAPSAVVNDLIKVIGKSKDLKTDISEIELDMQKLRTHVDDYLGAWFKKVSTRVSSSALFGSDLVNDPLYDQLITDGAILTSVVIPFYNIVIQLNEKSGISSKQYFENVKDELNIVESIKEKIIDKILKNIE